jgi:hypothetical protein
MWVGLIFDLPGSGDAMRVRSTASTEDCFAKFDEAFASLEAELDVVPARTERWLPQNPPPVSTFAPPALHLVTTTAGDLKLARQSEPPLLEEYEEAFSALDATLARHGTTPDKNPPAEARTTTAQRTAAATSVAPIAVAAPATSERALWRDRVDGGTPLERLFGTLQNLSLIQDSINNRGARGAERFTRDSVAQVFADVRELCSEFDLQTARVRADFALAALENDALDTLGGEVTELVRHIRHDLQSCSIWPIARNRVWSFSLALNDKAAAAFPSAGNDIAEGGRCFGFARYSAAVFHMLRAADPGVRALARAANATAAAAHEGGDWAPLLALVDARVSVISTWPAGTAKAAALEFFQSALSEARGLHDASRKLANPSAAATLEEHQALHVCHATKDLLVRLSERLTESHRRTLGKRDFLRPALLLKSAG